MTYRSAKRIYFMIMAAVTVSGFLMVCTMGRTILRKRQETLLTAAIEENVPEYTVRESRGRIAVFRRDEEKPYLLVDCDPALLSDYDREQLAAGLYFSSEQQLRQFIEDISS